MNNIIEKLGITKSHKIYQCFVCDKENPCMVIFPDCGEDPIGCLFNSNIPEWEDKECLLQDITDKELESGTGKVTIDSGADVCEWEEAEFHYMIPSCCGHDLNIKELVEDYNFCPYCGKPITIKGE